jgi:TolB-like protein
MKRPVLTAIVLVAAALATPGLAHGNPYDELADVLLAPVAQEEATVAVTPFDAPEDGTLDESLIRSVSAELIEAFTMRGVTVVERENIDRVIEEIRLQLSGLVAVEDAAQLGQALGAQYIVSGTVREFQEPEVENPGLRIRTRIVSVETAEVVATGSADVEKSDIRSVYEPRGRRRDPEYPTSLEILAGPAFPRVRYPGLDATDDAYQERLDVGLSAAVRHVPGATGFLANAREFNYALARRGDAEADAVVHTFRYNSQVFVRLPLWRYAESLPRLSNAYLGLGGGVGLTYHVPDADDYLGVSLAAHGFAGFMLALSENWGLQAQYRLYPRFASYGWFGAGADAIDGLEPVQTGAHTVLAGFAFMP